MTSIVEYKAKNTTFSSLKKSENEVTSIKLTVFVNNVPSFLPSKAKAKSYLTGQAWINAKVYIDNSQILDGSYIQGVDKLNSFATPTILLYLQILECILVIIERDQPWF